MKPAALIAVMLLITAMAYAQFSLLPQVGVERSKTLLSFNENEFSPLGGKASIKANIRLDYKFKKGHGPFVGFGTSPAPVEYNFAKISSALNDFKAATGSLQWRLEAGYQYTSKPISLKKSSAKNEKEKASVQNTEAKRSCGSYNRCSGQQKSIPAKKNNNLNMRLQPSLGLAYIPSGARELAVASDGYQYNAGNWKTALVSGVGFEFGKGKERIVTLSVYYTKGLGIQERTVSGLENGKPYTAVLSSENSSWGMTVGVPFTLTKNKKPVAKRQEQKQQCGSRTQAYKIKCVKQI